MPPLPALKSKNLQATPCLRLPPDSGAGFRQNRGPFWAVTCSHTLGALGMLGPVLQEADCRGLLQPHADNLEIQRPTKPRRGSWARMGAERESGPSRQRTLRMSPEGLCKPHPHFLAFNSIAQDLWSEEKPGDSGRLCS